MSWKVTKVGNKLLNSRYTFACRVHTRPQNDDIPGVMKSELSMHKNQGRLMLGLIEILNLSWERSGLCPPERFQEWNFRALGELVKWTRSCTKDENRTADNTKSKIQGELQWKRIQVPPTLSNYPNGPCPALNDLMVPFNIRGDYNISLSRYKHLTPGRQRERDRNYIYIYSDIYSNVPVRLN